MSLELSKEELELLLLIIKSSTFRGDFIELASSLKEKVIEQIELNIAVSNDKIEQ